MINYSHLANSKIFLILQEEWKILTQSFELKYEKPAQDFLLSKVRCYIIILIKV